MGRKQIDLKDSVYILCSQYPEIRDIMADSGFVDIVKPGMLGSVGRFMTLPLGAQMRNISLDSLKEGLRAHGFTFPEEHGS